MAVNYKGLPELLPINGVRIGVTAAGIKKEGRNDLVLFELAGTSTVAATFTRNQFCAAPVVLAKEHLECTKPKYLLINTGNANAGTGKQGYNNAISNCSKLASIAGCSVEEVLPFSTGVIGEQLPVERIETAISILYASLNDSHWALAATGILTTDTVEKGVSRQIATESGPITITGIAKGSGMIRPDMATMLAFVATDVEISQAQLAKRLKTAVDKSFNCITVDGDTSTNDACVLIATGMSGVQIGKDESTDTAFTRALEEVLIELAQLIIKDGEGATKFISIEVTGGATVKECKQVAYTVAHSPLVKTALFASDPNWGRILAAVGRSGLDALNVDKVDIYLDDVCLIRDGEPDREYSEQRGQKVMAKDEISIVIDLNRGSSVATVWTCDLSYDYVKINAEYRT